MVSKEINFLAGLCFSLRQILMSVQRGSLSVTTIHAVLTSQGGTTVNAEAVSMTMEATLYLGSPVLVSNDQQSAFFLTSFCMVLQSDCWDTVLGSSPLFKAETRMQASVSVFVSTPRHVVGVLIPACITALSGYYRRETVGEQKCDLSALHHLSLWVAVKPEVKVGFLGSIIGHKRGRAGFPFSSFSRAIWEHIWGVFELLWFVWFPWFGIFIIFF